MYSLSTPSQCQKETCSCAGCKFMIVRFVETPSGSSEQKAKTGSGQKQDETSELNESRTNRKQTDMTQNAFKWQSIAKMCQSEPIIYDYMIYIYIYHYIHTFLLPSLPRGQHIEKELGFTRLDVQVSEEGHHLSVLRKGHESTHMGKIWKDVVQKGSKMEPFIPFPRNRSVLCVVQNLFEGNLSSFVIIKGLEQATSFHCLNGMRIESGMAPCHNVSSNPLHVLHLLRSADCILHLNTTPLHTISIIIFSFVYCTRISYVLVLCAITHKKGLCFTTETGSIYALIS